jgi:hypothetical protein
MAIRKVSGWQVGSIWRLMRMPHRIGKKIYTGGGIFASVVILSFILDIA